MDDKATENATPHHEPCICREIGAHLTALFGVGSEETWNHVRNARVEMLKAVRSIIDARIEHLSGLEHKGTKVTVE